LLVPLDRLSLEQTVKLESWRLSTLENGFDDGDALASLPRFAIYNGLNAWGKDREMPHPPAETFHQWYVKNRGGKQ
jgi:hypothetical protein